MSRQSRERWHVDSQTYPQAVSPGAIARDSDQTIRRLIAHRRCGDTLGQPRPLAGTDGQGQVPGEVLTGCRRASRGTASGLPAPKPLGRAWRQRLPSGDDARALPRLQVVCDTGEQAPQLDRGRQLALLLECGADRSGFCLGNDEHLRSMVKQAGTDKRLAASRCRASIPSETRAARKSWSRTDGDVV